MTREGKKVAEECPEIEPPSVKRIKIDRSETPTSSCSSEGHPQLVVNRKDQKQFVYGNYAKYYGYRKTQDDPRISLFKEYKDVFVGKEILDIGCHTGVVTLQIAKLLKPKKIDGIDIDKNLIRNARKLLANEIKSSSQILPISYHVGNYVLENDALLKAEVVEKYDTIICLSVTKWIQLNFGDDGLKRAFQRMYRQLRNGGKLVLEAQPFKGYRKRKKLTEEIKRNFDEIQLLPKMFPDYLLSIGFRSMELLNKAAGKGFDRPIQVFTK